MHRGPNGALTRGGYERMINYDKPGPAVKYDASTRSLARSWFRMNT